MEIVQTNFKDRNVLIRNWRKDVAENKK